MGRSLSGGQLCAFAVQMQNGSFRPVMATNGQPLSVCASMTQLPGQGMMNGGMMMNSPMMMNGGMMNTGMMNGGMVMNGGVYNGSMINNGMMMNPQMNMMNPMMNGGVTPAMMNNGLGMQMGFVFDFGAGAQFNAVAVVEQQFLQQMALHIQSQGAAPPYSFGRIRQ